jgi:hypothetical protein
MSSGVEATTTDENPGSMGLIERYLSVWVALAITTIGNW